MTRKPDEKIEKSGQRTAQEALLSLERNVEEYERVAALMEPIQKQADDLKAKIKEDMSELGKSKYTTDDYTFSKTNASVRRDIDKNKLENDYPSVYKAVMKITNVSASFRVTKVKKKDKK